MNWLRVRELVKKEFLQVLREPRMRTVLIVPPIVQTILFGFAVNLDVERARIAWFDQDRSVVSRELRQRFEATPYFSIVAAPENVQHMTELLDRGEVQAVLRILPGFGADVKRKPETPVQVIVDGTNSNTAAIIASYAAEVSAGYAADTMAERMEERKVRFTMRAGGPVNATVPGLDVETRVWFNPNLLSRNFFVPGVVVNIIALVTVILTALSIVREKEIGTIEQLIVTPITPVELLLGKTLPFALIGLVEMGFITTLALVIFQVPLRGSLWVLLISSALFLTTTLGAGLFISTICRTQQQAMISTFLMFFPMMLLSGFAFPIRNMPVVIQWLTYLNPVRYFMQVVRGVFLKGTGLAVLWPEVAAMAAFGVVIFTLSALRFHKRLE